MKVVVVTPIPTPYRDAFWNYFSQLQNISLHVIYCAAGKADRPWKNQWDKQYPFTFPKGMNLLSWKSKDASLYFNPGVLSILKGTTPDIVLVGGYNHLTMWMAMMWSFLKGVPFLLMSETRGLRPGRKKDPFLKKLLLRWQAKSTSGALPTGCMAEEYLRKNGWKQETLFRFPNVPDIEVLQSQVIQLKQHSVDLKAKWKLKDEKLILCVGRLIRKKHVDLIIQAFSKVRTPFPANLIIIGDGDQSNLLKKQCHQLGIEDRVRFLGFLEPSEMMEWLALADVFALASNETWGVAPIEAAAAGTQLLLSNEIGSAKELAALYPATTIISDRKINNWKEAMENSLKNITLANAETTDNTSMSPWYFNALAPELDQYLNRIIQTAGVIQTPE